MGQNEHREREKGPTSTAEIRGDVRRTPSGKALGILKRESRLNSGLLTNGNPE